MNVVIVNVSVQSIMVSLFHKYFFIELLVTLTCHTLYYLLSLVVVVVVVFKLL